MKSFSMRCVVVDFIKRRRQYAKLHITRGKVVKSIQILKSIVLVPFLIGCSGLEQGEQEKIRRQNARAEVIYRRHDEVHYAIPPLTTRLRENYPWEEGYVGLLPPITKEWFRCRGSGVNPTQTNTPIPGQAPIVRADCQGAQRHSLSLRNGEEFIYPILLEILNDLQSKTGQKVVVTCGYRCPQHNTYADTSSQNQVSKHMIGAEVDFYVQGFENRPEEIVKLVQQFYRQERYKGKKEYQEFERYEKKDTDVSTLPWYNKEIFIKLYRKSEGRDMDNRHPYPYISVQVRFDRDLNEKVTYSWQKANTCYKRY